MVRIAARSGPDMVAGDTNGVMVTFEGKAVLSSRNRCPNPDCRDFDSRGRLRYWDRLGASRAPQFWNWYAQGAEVPTYARQNGSGVAIATTTVQAGPLVIGSPLPDPTKQVAIAPPGRQLLEVIDLARVGFTEGWRGIAFALITGPDPINPLARRVTPPGPRSTLYVAQGRGIRVFPYQEIPKGPVGLAVLVTLHQTSEAAARTADLFFLRGIDLRRERRASFDLNGPFLARALTDQGSPTAGALNDTYIGAKGRWPAPSYSHLSSAYDTEAMKDTLLSWRFRTVNGVSAMQKEVSVTTGRRKLSRLAFLPRAVPEEAIEWQPIFMGKDGQRYALVWRRIGLAASLYSNDIEWFTPRYKPESYDGGEGEDTTGVPAPDEEMTAPESFGVSAISPGAKDIRSTWGIVDEDGAQDESAPGPRARVTLNAGQTVRIYRPPTANAGKNPEFVERDAVTGNPLHWRLPTTPGVTNLPNVGVLKLRDTSSGTGKVTVVKTPPAKHVPASPSAGAPGASAGAPQTHRMHVKINAALASAGAVKVYANVLKKTTGATVRTYVKNILRSVGVASAQDVGDVTVASLFDETAEQDPLASVSAQGFDDDLGEDIEVTIGEIGSGADIEVADIEESDLELEFDGEGQARNLDVDLANWNVFPGYVAGRKRHDDEGDADGGDVSIAATATTGEKPSTPYLDAGYCKVVRDPKSHERPVALAGLLCNMIEYYGPYGTPSSDQYGPSGLKLPVKPGSLNVFSVYLWWKGGTTESIPLRMAVKDSQGRTIRVLPPMISFAGSSSTVADRDANNWVRRYAGFTAEANAAYVEFVGGPVGDGLIRFMGFQYEQDRLVPTTFTSENGVYGEIISSLDTGIPNAPYDPGTGMTLMPFNLHGRVKELLRAGVISTALPGEGTSVEVDYSCKLRTEIVWRPWVADWRDLTTSEQVRVRAKLRTTDTTRSPEVQELYADIERFQPVLTRENGSEFDGGVQVVDLSTRMRKRPIQELEYADFSDGFRVMGKERDDLVFGLQGYLDVGVEQVMDLVGVGESTFVVEDLGKRYRVRVLEIDFGQPDRMEHDRSVGPNGSRHYGAYMHNATGVKGRIVQESPLRGNP